MVTLTTSVNTIRANVDSVAANVSSIQTNINTVSSNVSALISGATAFTGNITVVGTAAINAISANGSVGTSGQVLTSNGAGIYWSTVSGGGGGGSTATYGVTIGNASNTSFTVTHSLDKTNIFVSTRDITTGYFVYPDVKYLSTNAVLLEFIDPPATNQYYVAVIGA